MDALERTELAQRYVELALDDRGGSDAVRLILEHVVDGRLGLLELYEHVLAPAQTELGDRWHRNEISVADEHYATELTRRVMALASGFSPVPRPQRGTVVLAAPAEEAHDLPLRMAFDLLEREALDVRLLGAVTPTAALAAFVERTRPDAVAFTCSTAEAARGAEEAVAAVRRIDPSIRVVLAGRYVALHPALAQHAGADAYVTALGSGIRLIGELVDERRGSRGASS